MSTVFRPLNRVLVDILIATNLGLFVLSAIGLFPLKLFLFVAVAASLIEVFVWFLVIRNLFSVTLTEDRMTGSNEYFIRISVSLADLSYVRSEERSKASVWWGYRDVWTKDAKKRIRLWRRLLGRRQIYKIWKTLGWGDAPGGNKPLIYYPPYSR